MIPRIKITYITMDTGKTMSDTDMEFNLNLQQIMSSNIKDFGN